MNLLLRLFKPQALRNVFLVGSSCATLGFVGRSSQEFSACMETVTSTRDFLMLVACLLVASNSLLGFKLYQSWVSESENQGGETNSCTKRSL